MPMYFFHIHTVDGAKHEDKIGAPFETDEEAIQEARDFTRGVMRDAADHGESVEHAVEVTDESGRSLVRVKYRAMLEDEPLGHSR
jgi:hypothetical protein